MLDFNNNFYTDTKTLLSYINGFLHVLEQLNFFTNHVPTFYVQQIERCDSYNVSICKHLNDVNYDVSFKEVINWREEFEKAASSFFESFYEDVHILNEHQFTTDNKKEQIRDMLHMSNVLQKYIALMDELIIDKSKFFEVYVDNSKGEFYECEYKDFLVDNANGLFFIHFGMSD